MWRAIFASLSTLRRCKPQLPSRSMLISQLFLYYHAPREQFATQDLRQATSIKFHFPTKNGRVNQRKLQHHTTLLTYFNGNMNTVLSLFLLMALLGCTNALISRPMRGVSRINRMDTKCFSATKTASSEPLEFGEVETPDFTNFLRTVPQKAIVFSALLTLLSTFGFQQPAVAANLLDIAFGGGTDTTGGLVQSFLLVFISEIGDKTFFIAGLLAAKYGRLLSFTGAMGALGVMTIISTILGQIFHAIPASLTQGVPFDDVIAVLAFTYFGASTLYDAYQLEDGDSSGMEEEKAEAEEIVQDLDEKRRRSSALSILVQIFSLVFAAEIGDRSFLSTIALSAAQNPVAVATGAIAAHGSATGIAVIGGAFMSKYLSEKVIGYIGGSLFLVFAATTAVGLF